MAPQFLLGWYLSLSPDHGRWQHLEQVIWSTRLQDTVPYLSSTKNCNLKPRIGACVAARADEESGAASESLRESHQVLAAQNDKMNQQIVDQHLHNTYMRRPWPKAKEKLENVCSIDDPENISYHSSRVAIDMHVILTYTDRQPRNSGINYPVTLLCTLYSVLHPRISLYLFLI